MAMATSQRAWTIVGRGSPSTALSLNHSLPLPTLPKDTPNAEEQLLVKVAFAALNPGSLLSMSLIPTWARRSKFSVPEMDFSGIVTAVSGQSGKNGLARFRKGDRVGGMVPAAHALTTGTGALAEYVKVPAKYVAKVDGAVKLADAAGGMVGGMMAKRLVDAAKVGKGDRVLVNGASGGVGTMAVQMARNAVGEKGLVVAVCSGKNADLVKSLGADTVIDYTQHPDLPEHIIKTCLPATFDAIIDTVGIQSLYTNSAAYLTPNGVYAATGIKFPSLTMGSVLKAVWQMKLNEIWPLSPWMMGTGRTWRSVELMDPSTEEREAVQEMLARGEVKVVRDSVWRMEDAKGAYEKLEGGHCRGKVIIKVDGATGDDV